MWRVALKLSSRLELRRFLQNIEQLLGAVHAVTLSAADFFDDTLLFQLCARVASKNAER